LIAFFFFSKKNTSSSFQECPSLFTRRQTLLELADRVDGSLEDFRVWWGLIGKEREKKKRNTLWGILIILPIAYPKISGTVQ